MNWSLADQAMVSGVNFLTGILLARHVGLHEFGVFTLAMTALRFVSSTQQSLIIAPMMTFGPKQNAEETEPYYTTVFTHQLAFATASSLVLLLVVLAVAAFSDHAVVQLAVPLASATFAFQLQDFTRRHFLSRDRVRVAFANDVISYVGQLVVLLILFQIATVSAADVLWIVAGTSMLAAVIGLARFRGGLSGKDALRTVARRHWGFSKWILLSSQMHQLGRYPPTWALAAFLGSTVVGAVQASGNVLGFLHVLYFGLDNIVQPTAARVASREGVPATLRTIRHLGLLTGIPVVIVCGCVALFPGTISGWLYGPHLLEGYETIILLFSISYFINFLKRPLTWFLLATEQTKAIATAQALESVVMVVLCVPVIKYLEVPGLMGLLLGTTTLGLVALVVRVRGYLSREADGP